MTVILGKVPFLILTIFKVPPHFWGYTFSEQMTENPFKSQKKKYKIQYHIYEKQKWKLISQQKEDSGLKMKHVAKR